MATDTDFKAKALENPVVREAYEQTLKEFEPILKKLEDERKGERIMFEIIKEIIKKANNPEAYEEDKEEIKALDLNEIKEEEENKGMSLIQRVREYFCSHIGNFKHTHTHNGEVMGEYLQCIKCGRISQLPRVIIKHSDLDIMRELYQKLEEEETNDG